MQSIINIVAHDADRIHLTFNATKTAITVTGSKQDMEFYHDNAPWELNGERLNVVDDNEHLGLIVSGYEEEQKNCDQNIIKCRNSLFAMLGSVYAYKCLLSPSTQLHIWRTCNLPILLSGLEALPIRPGNTKSLELFQRKILRSFLKISQTSPRPAVYFLLGELPVEGLLHIRDS